MSYNSAIYGDRIVWHDFRTGNDNIYIYDIPTSKEIQVTTNISEQEFPAIYGNKIVWHDYRNLAYKPDIYVGTVDLPPAANFWGSPKSGDLPLSVTFTDISTGEPTAWRWDFGDGTYSTLQNPVHKYTKPGIFSVTLTVSNVAGTETLTKNNYINIETDSQKPVAAFSASATSGIAPLSVTFSDASTNSPTSWSWNLGDGTSSTARNPTHKYTSAGSYTVILTATNAAGSNTVTKSAYIKVPSSPTPQKPVANFWGSPKSGNLPLSVTFTDISAGSPTAWTWNFGDGTPNSTVKSPVHTYNKAGKYSVILTVKNAAGISSLKKSVYINVSK
jgi:beta propeller repeat protein